MDYKMEIIVLLLCVIPAFVTSISISSNGNSPDIKMKRGMMVDMEQGFVPTAVKAAELSGRTAKAKSKKNGRNSSKLTINERYRRLIPYMTFYYANDLAAPTTEHVKEVEVEKAQIIEASGVGHDHQREPKKIIYSNTNIPRYQGNRLTQHNIASANPTKIFYKNGVPVYQIPNKVTPNFNPLLQDYNVHSDYEPTRIIHKPSQLVKTPNIVFYSSTRKPFLNFHSGDSPNVKYYLSEKDQSPKYKLVPYEQTPPVKVNENENIYDITKTPVHVPVLVPKEQIYIKPRPARPHYNYEDVNIQPPTIRKQPSIVSENYYEKQQEQRPSYLAQPFVQSGFKPILNSPQYTKEETVYTTALPERIISDAGHQQYRVPFRPAVSVEDVRPNYYQYVVDQTTASPPQELNSNSIPLAALLNSLQLNKSIPKPITKENVGSSIRTLLQVLNALKAVPQHNDVEVPVLSTPKPFIGPKVVDVAAKPVIQPIAEPVELVSDEDLHKEPYLVHVNVPSQHLDDNPSNGGTSQQFPPPVTSDDEGGTPGKPGVDYPILTVIPPTSFDCKTQRYKGFFADPETRCQVWHYCDLNGGQASFLCPNGTIFSQAGLTCDWWFNVRCAQTTQLYVLNESLYKYILPHSPKFPEDYSGPLVDKYLTLKFKEMEEEFKKNKNKQSAAEKMDSDEDSTEESSEDSTEKDMSIEGTVEMNEDKGGENADNEPSVIVESPGTSGNVERLQD